MVHLSPTGRDGYELNGAGYAIHSLDEAVAYLQHAMLGPRLLECTALVNAISNREIHQIFPSPDEMKFRSSMTLFGRATSEIQPFRLAIERYFRGEEDQKTLALLGLA